MTSLYTNAPELFGELSLEIRLFTDERRIEQTDCIKSEGMCIAHTSDESSGFFSEAVLYLDGVKASEGSVFLKNSAASVLEFKKYKKRAAKQSVYDCLKAYFQQNMPWGSLTGIRPTKLFRQISNASGKDAARAKFLREFFVSDEKTSLAETICGVQQKIIASANTAEIDVYIGIPFCTTKCAYCSFSSGLTSKNGELERRYVDALIREIELMKPVFEKYPVRSLYIGGGTPTALEACQLARVLACAGQLASCAEEFTVEAGRPDTITADKLQLIKDASADRISVNAQTTCDRTLKRIGRAHTASDFFRAFELAKGFGFHAVNTDIIAGLPGENAGDVENTLRDMIRVGADNITVHTLAIKNGSKFAEENARAFASGQEAEAMVGTARRLACEAGYCPYYLYRQKYMAGNLENVGYALPGKECIYNIDIMEETMSVIALGAGGISKRLFAEQDKIERAANVKDIKNYVERTAEMANRKLELFLR